MRFFLSNAFSSQSVTKRFAPKGVGAVVRTHSVPSGTCLRIAYTSAIRTRDSLCGGGGVLAGGRREHLYKNGQNRLRWRIDDCVIAKAQLP